MRFIDCQHCGNNVPMSAWANHTRDTGEATTCPPYSCTVLFKRRQGTSGLAAMNADEFLAWLT